MNKANEIQGNFLNTLTKYQFGLMHKGANSFLESLGVYGKILLLSAVVAIAGCTMTGKYWKKTISEDTILSYEDFLRRYPDSEFNDKALVRLEHLYDKRDWEEVQSKDTIDVYKDFLEKHANSKFVDKARSRLEHLSALRDWEIAFLEDTIPVYYNFLKDHRASQFADQAQKRLEQLELSVLNSAWKETQSQNTLEANEIFLRKYPESEFTAQAGELLEELGINLQEVIITREHINKTKKGEKKYIFPIVTIGKTSEAPYIIVKGFNRKYIKVTPTGSENFTL